MAPKVVIIGGGISGLSTAYYLAKRGAASTILESRPRLGGVIQTEHVEGCTLEAGPDSFLSVKPAGLELIADLGLASEVIGSNNYLTGAFLCQERTPGPAPRRPDDDGAHQDSAADYDRAGELGHQAADGPGMVPRAQTKAGRRIGGRVRGRALRPGSSRLSGRAAALGHLRRQSQRAERQKRAAALRRAGGTLRQPDARGAGGTRQGCGAPYEGRTAAAVPHPEGRAGAEPRPSGRAH